MAQIKNLFTLKILLSYLVLGILAGLVGWFLFSEIKNYSEEINLSGEKKLVETGTLINLLYKTDGFSRLALLTENDEDFENYMRRNDSLFSKIDEIKELATDAFQRKQLDSIKALLTEKNQNIEQLRILRLTNQKETSLDDIMKEVRKLENMVGLASVESMVREPWKLSPRERRIWQSYADYLNSSKDRDTSMIKSKDVDAMLIASRYIVAEAKKEHSRIRESLIQKENELIRNDLDISERLREIISSFDAEIAKNNADYAETRVNSLHKTGQILKFAAVLGVMIVLLFSYFVLSDFFRAERYKRFLETSKKYAESLLRSREQLISTVSHDLNTPLNTISGYSELMGHTDLNQKQENYLTQIQTSVSFISGLMNDLLDFSKLEAGKLNLEKISFSLSQLIADTSSSVSRIYKKEAVSFEVNIASELQTKLFESDPLRIRQILNNLLTNAFKFTASGFVSVNAEVLHKKQDTIWVAIAVTDTGIGISQERQQAIFEEFTQADASISGRFGGSGLGLAISKKLTSLLNGELSVHSEMGKGSRFVLKLPLKEILVRNTSAIPETAPVYRAAVVIDDDEGMRTLIAEILTRSQIEALVFGSFDEFSEKDRQKDLMYDFILTDIQMPGTDGFSVLKKLQQEQIRSYRQQPVIAMTGSDEFSRQTFLEKGFSDVLRKPFSSEEFVGFLNSRFPYDLKIIQDTTPALPSSKSARFNLKMLYSFLDSEEAAIEILRDLTKQTQADLVAIENAIEVLDYQAVSDIAHRMLTMYRQIEAVEIIPVLEALEANDEMGKAEIIRLFTDLKERISALNQEFTHLF